MTRQILRKCTSLLVASFMILSMFVVLVPTVAFANNTTYYVDPSGNDNNNGTSTGSAWQTLTKVNNTTFQPGDRLLFKANGSWTGQLWPKGSGSSGSPIVIDMYNSGSKPAFNAASNGTATVLLQGQQYWEINNLDVTNSGSNTSTINKLINIDNNTSGLLSHITIKNCRCHDVQSIRNGGGCFFTGGICFTNSGSGVHTSYWNDILVDNNTIENGNGGGVNLLNNGYWSAPNTFVYSTNVRIQNNTMSNLGADGIVCGWTNGTLIDHNVVANCGKDNDYYDGIWPRTAQNTTVQYNEVYGFGPAGGAGDGWALDNDLECPGSTFQYNYTHANKGFFLECSGGTTIRYNISQSETLGQPLIQGGQSNMSYYNNTFYIPSGDGSTVVNGSGSGSTYKNNIFYQQGSGGYNGGSATFDYNLFYGNHPGSEPSDAHKITSNPNLVSPGSGGTGLNTVDGYKLQSGSPALNAGTLVSSNGGKDYWGNTVSSSSAPNIGAYNGAGVGGSAPGQATNPTPANGATGVDTSTILSWTAGSGATSHDVYFGTSNPPSFVQNQAGTTYNTGALSANSTYYWRIDAKNGSGTTTGSVWSFTTGSSNIALSATATASATDTGNGYSPAYAINGSTAWPGWASPNPNTTDWLELTWSANQSVNKVSLYTTPTLCLKDYDLQYWDGSAYQTILQVRNNSSSHITSTFTAITTNKLRVYCITGDSYGTSGYKRIEELEVYGSGGSAPSQATSPNPSNGATGVSTSPSLSWTAGSGATSRDVYFGTTSPGSLIGNQTGTTYSPGTLTANTTYYWRINEKNGYGTTTGTVWSFTTTSGGSNLAIGATPSASSTDTGEGYDYHRINDGTIGDFNGWSSNAGTPQWCQLDFSSSTTFTRVELYTSSSGYQIKDYDLQYWNGSTWQTAAQVRSNTATHVTSTFTAVTSTKLRLYGITGDVYGYIRVEELQVFNDGAQNLLQNPGFETGSLSSWTNYGGASVVASNAHGGTYALQVGSSNTGAHQVISGLQPSTTYTLNGWIKNTNAGDVTYLGVKDFGGTETNSNVTTSSYSQATVTFTTGSSNTTADIYVWKNGGTANSYADDISVVH